jgi:heptaprenyl diphosphate synthase
MRSRAEKGFGEARASRYAASAAALQSLESFIPYPLPGVKLGLANLVTQVVLVRHGFLPALETAVHRVLASSLMLGSFLSPGFALSLGGSLVSTVAMGGAARLGATFRPAPLSLVGISVLGAMAHLLAQLALVYLLFLHHPGVFALAPWLLAIAVVTGWINGTLALRALGSRGRGKAGVDDGLPRRGRASRSLIGRRAKRPGRDELPIPDSFLRRAPAWLKMAGLLAIAVALAFTADLLLLAAACASACGFAFIGRVGFRLLLVSLWRSLPLAVLLMAIPAVSALIGSFQGRSPSGGWGDALASGSAAALRLLSLALCARILTSTTPPRELAACLGRLFAPLRFFRMNPARFGAILSGTLTLLPQVTHGLMERFRIHREADRSRGRVLATAGAFLGAVLSAASPRRERHPE